MKTGERRPTKSWRCHDREAGQRSVAALMSDISVSTTVWHHFRRAGDQLRHLLDNDRAAEMLTEEELDWAVMLRDRFYELHNRRPTHDA